VRLRPVLTTLSTTVLLAGSVAAVPAAQAVPSGGCEIRDFSPREAVIGAGFSGVVTFELDTTCPVDADINWYLTAQHRTPGPYGWLLRANFYQPPWSRYQWTPDGVIGFGRRSNSDAGAYTLSWSAFLGESGTTTTRMGFSSTFHLKRGTTFYGHPDPRTQPNVEPETVARGGTLTITGSLRRANWEAGQFEPDTDPYAAPVVVQFRHDDASKYSDVTTVRTGADGAFSTTVTAKKSGDWRVVYRGDDTSGAAESLEDHVVVTTR
jgi:hypothetical protein